MILNKELMIVCGIDMKSPDLGNINPNATDDEQTANTTKKNAGVKGKDNLMIAYEREGQSRSEARFQILELKFNIGTLFLFYQ